MSKKKKLTSLDIVDDDLALDKKESPNQVLVRRPGLDSTASGNSGLHSGACSSSSGGCCACSLGSLACIK